MENKNHITPGLFNSVIDGINLGIIGFDESSEPVFINGAGERFLNSENHPVSHRNEPSDHPLLDKIRKLHVEENALYKLERNGQIMHLSLHAFRVVSDKKSYKIVIIKDIHEELEERELQSWQQIIRILNHDIMNAVIPLATLTDVNLGIIEEIQRNYQLTPRPGSDQDSGEEKLTDVAEGLKVIEGRSRRIARFARDTQTYMSISRPNIRKINVNELLNRVYTFLLTAFNNQSIDFVLELPNDSVYTAADYEMIEQALFLILRNAQDALNAEDLSPEPRVILSLSYGREGVSIEIEDNGPGISAEDLDRIFIPFFTTKPENTGLGLSMARQIIHLNRGKLYVQSEKQKRTVFRVLMPVVAS